MVYIHNNAPETAYVSLMADHGTPKFYERFGFIASLPPEKSGMSLRIKNTSLSGPEDKLESNSGR